MSRFTKDIGLFTQIANELIKDKNLSWSAKGVYCYLASKKDGWQFYQQEIAKNSSNGIDATRTAIQQLVKFGWLSRSATMGHNEKGYNSGYDYHLHNKPYVGKPNVGEPHTSNTNKSNTNKSKVTKVTLASAVKKEKPPISDEVLKHYYKAVSELSIPVKNNSNLKIKSNALKKEVGEDGAIKYLRFIAEQYQSLPDDGFKPSLSEGMDIYAKRGQIGNWINKRINKPTKGTHKV